MDDATGEVGLLVERRTRVAVITIDRPSVRNSLDSGLLRALPRVVAELDGDDAIGAIVLTGTDPAFCAGLDLTELGSSGANLRAGAPEAGDLASYRGPLGHLDTPLIGAINGPAVTGGLELALACDFLVASERARFADTHARVGIHPGWGMTVLLPEAVGRRRAREMSLTGRMVDARTAYDWGLVNHVVAHDELLSFAVDLADAIAEGVPEMVRSVRSTYLAAEDLRDADSWACERDGVRRFLAAGFDPGDVAARRAGVIERGRRQI